MNDRNCYCPDTDQQPEWLLEDNIPYGYCGIAKTAGSLDTYAIIQAPSPTREAGAMIATRKNGNSPKREASNFRVTP